MCPAKVAKRLTSVAWQTAVSCFSEGSFDHSRDSTVLAEESRPAFAYSPGSVQRLVSAVQGEDEDIRKKCRVLNTRASKFGELLDSLQGQIDKLESNPAKIEQRQKMIEAMAAAIDPASRHRISPRTLFDRAVQDRPIRSAEAYFKRAGAGQVTVNTVLSRNGVLSIITNDEIWQINGVTADQVSQGKKLQCSIDGDAGELNFRTTTDANDLLGQLNLEFDKLVNLYDFSFIDIVLSIPTLDPNEALFLLSYLIRKKFLSAYLRSKICELLLRRECKWPDMIGRFIESLDPEWVKRLSSEARALKVVPVMEGLKSLSGPAKYVLGVALEIFSGMHRGPVEEFLWTVIWTGVFMNKCLGKDQDSERMRSNFFSLLNTLRERPEDSMPREVTRGIAQKIITTKTYKPGKADWRGLRDIFTNHTDEIAEVMRSHPGTKNEASPLYFPLVLEIQEALESPENDYYGNSEVAVSAVAVVSDKLSDTRSVGSRSSKSGVSRSSKAGKTKKNDIGYLDEGSDDSDEDRELSEGSASTGSRSTSKGSRAGIREVPSKASGVSRSSAKRGITPNSSKASGVSSSKKGITPNSSKASGVSSSKKGITPNSSKASGISSSKKGAELSSSKASGKFSDAPSRSSKKGVSDASRSSSKKKKQPEPELLSESDIEEEELVYEEDEEEEELVIAYEEEEEEEEEAEFEEYEAPEEEEIKYDHVTSDDDE